MYCTPWTRTAAFVALLALGLASAPAAARAEAVATIAPDAIERHAAFLASEALEGRGTGSPGERLAAEYLAAELAQYGLEPGAADGTFFQPFQVAGQARLEGASHLELQVGTWSREFRVGRDYNPFGFSGSLERDGIPLVFAGYGVVDPERDYDDYAGLDVRGKAVLVLRHEPNEQEGIGRHSLFTTKAEHAKAQGAVAMLVVTDPVNHPDDDSLLPFSAGDDLGIYAVHVRRSLIEAMFRLAERDLAAVQRGIDAARAPDSFALDARVSVKARIARSAIEARNVVARLPGSDPALRHEAVVVGAHYDHVGRGDSGTSLAPRGGGGEIHYGADDNASGTAGLLEIARAFALAPPRRTVYFVAFSGEERGLLGSAHFVRDPPLPLEDVVAMLNLDMIGRLRDGTFEVGGVDTSPGFRALATESAAAEGLPARLVGSGTGPSDHASFYRAGVPVLFFFTGLHADYHRPSDRVELLNLEGASQVARIAFRCARGVADADARPPFVQTRRARARSSRPQLGVQLAGPGAAASEGVAVARVVDRSPAAAAGVRPGDVLVGLGDHAVVTLRDLQQALDACGPGTTVPLRLRRGDEELTLQVTFPRR